MFKFCPLVVPLSRRLQTVSVCIMIAFVLFGPIIGSVAFLALFLSRFWILSVIYACWIVYDHETPSCGGRRIHWFRKLTIWRHLRDYFPVTIIKTTELDPKRNYIMGYHPHGVFAAGAFINFATEGNCFSDDFAGITPYLLTLKCKFFEYTSLAII